MDHAAKGTVSLLFFYICHHGRHHRRLNSVIAVKKENQITGCQANPGVSGGTDTLVFLVDDAELVIVGILVTDLTAAVCRTVVNKKKLQVTIVLG